MSGTFERMCLGTTKTAFRLTETNCESLPFSLMTTWWLPFCRTEAMFGALAEGADDVHRLVLLAGGEAVDDVGGRQRLAVRPPDVLADLERQRLAVLAPAVALGEPLVLAAAAGGRRDHERLVDAAAHERRRRQALDVRVEVAHERRIARAGRDEALVRRGGAPGAGGRRGVRARAGAERYDDERRERLRREVWSGVDSSLLLVLSELCGAFSHSAVGRPADVPGTVNRFPGPGQGLESACHRTNCLREPSTRGGIRE